MRWARFVSVCVVVCFVSVVTVAQDYKGEVHGGYSYLNIDTNGLTSRQSANGWEAGASGNFNKWFGVEFSGAGYYKTYNVDLGPLGFGTIGIKVRDYSYEAGPRLNYKMVFVHAMLGGDHLSGSAAGFSASQGGFAGAFGGGIQQRIVGPWAVRVSADYVFSRHNIFGGSSYTQNNYRAGVGIAYTFGGVARKDHSISMQGGGKSNAAAYAPASMPIPALGIAVITTPDNRGAQIVEISAGSVAEFAGLHRTYVITSVNEVDVHTPMELAASLSGASGNVKIAYRFMTDAGWWIGKETTVVIGK